MPAEAATMATTINANQKDSFNILSEKLAEINSRNNVLMPIYSEAENQTAAKVAKKYSKPFDEIAGKDLQNGAFLVFC